MDLGDFHRAACHDSSYSTVSSNCRAHNRVLQLPLRLQAPTSQTFHTERLPRRPIAQRWSTIIYPFSDFILKDFPGGPSRGASQLILCFHHPLRSQLCFGQANVSLNRVSHKRAVSTSSLQKASNSPAPNLGVVRQVFRGPTFLRMWEQCFYQLSEFNKQNRTDVHNSMAWRTFRLISFVSTGHCLDGSTSSRRAGAVAGQPRYRSQCKQSRVFPVSSGLTQGVVGFEIFFQFFRSCFPILLA